MTDLEYYETMIELKDYSPRVIEHEWDNRNKYFSVLVHDDNGNYPDVWLDARVYYGDLDVDWDMWRFHKMKGRKTPNWANGVSARPSTPTVSALREASSLAVSPTALVRQYQA